MAEGRGLRPKPLDLGNDRDGKPATYGVVDSETQVRQKPGFFRRALNRLVNREDGEQAENNCGRTVVFEDTDRIRYNVVIAGDVDETQLMVDLLANGLPESRAPNSRLVIIAESKTVPLPKPEEDKV